MKLRIDTRTLLAVGIGLTFAACFNTDVTCHDLLTCPKPASGGMGAAGNATGAPGGAAASGGGAGVTGTGGFGAEAGLGEGGTSAVGAGGSGGSTAGGNDGRGGKAGSSGAAGSESGGGQGGAEPDCDQTKSPADEACLVSNDYAIFVSPDGDNAGTGEQSDPVKTLARALSVAHSAGKLVIACSTSGAFTEQVSITAALDGSKLYGGFDCDTWQYHATKKTAVTSPQTTALRIDAVTSGVSIEDFTFQAADATAAGASSLGAFITGSNAVRLERVSIAAGKGADGTNGVGTSTPALTGAAGNDGHDACSAAAQPNLGGSAVTSTCDGVTSESVGGKGGDAGNDNGNAGNGDNGEPGTGAVGGYGDNGDGSWKCDVGTGLGTGHGGANGESKDPAPGASSIGMLTSSDFVGTPGTDGESGTPGEGGGGGGGAKAPATCAANPRTGASGGGGGGGGCGGKGGTGGKAGGSSVALAVLDSTVTLNSVGLVASGAGKGGDGGVWQPGGNGGSPGGGGTAVGADNACDGGKGGKGGDGGSGGGAAGGVSVGILWSGTSAPTQSAVTFTTGTSGTKGVGGSVGTNDGVDGVAQDVWESP